VPLGIGSLDGSSKFIRSSGAYLSDYTQLHVVTEVGTLCSAMICEKLMECLRMALLRKHNADSATIKENIHS